jgi:hypothetical protein
MYQELLRGSSQPAELWFILHCQKFLFIIAGFPWHRTTRDGVVVAKSVPGKPARPRPS